MKNLFDYATKELSQDAFLRWLFENYDCENKKVRNVCEKLFNAFTNNELNFSKIDKNSLRTVAQWKNIDVSIWFAIDDKKYRYRAKEPELGACGRVCGRGDYGYASGQA